MHKILVVEYPKSGGTWLVSMLGDTLSLQKRDLYVREGFNLFNIKSHPWYENSSDLDMDGPCVIKSHELPGSPLHNFHAKIIHLIRDGRDVVVSKYFYEKEFCVQNGLIEKFNFSFDEYIEKTASEWAQYVSAWLAKNAVVCRYEDLCRTPGPTLTKLLSALHLHVPADKLHSAINANSRERLSNSLSKAFPHNTFVRSAKPGDWMHFFKDHHKKIFRICAGDLLRVLAYERDPSWSNSSGEYPLQKGKSTQQNRVTPSELPQEADTIQIQPIENGVLSKQKTLQEVKDFYWYHCIDLGDGVITDGDYDLRPLVDHYGFPDDMTGMSVLDVGRGSGFFSFEFERRGAQVVATDIGSYFDWDFCGGEKKKEEWKKGIGDEKKFSWQKIYGAFETAKKMKRFQSRKPDLSTCTTSVQRHLEAGYLILSLLDHY